MSASSIRFACPLDHREGHKRKGTSAFESHRLFADNDHQSTMEKTSRDPRVPNYLLDEKKFSIKLRIRVLEEWRQWYYSVHQRSAMSFDFYTAGVARLRIAETDVQIDEYRKQLKDLIESTEY